MHGGVGYMRQARLAGASGYVVKDGPSEELCRAIRAVCSGGTYFPRLPGTDACPLTPREVETLRLICRGLRSKDIAKALGISLRTVDAHRMNIREKLGLDTVAELIGYAHENALV
jgi:DNA-binding NarL/FixJ family response regulator